MGSHGGGALSWGGGEQAGPVLGVESPAGTFPETGSWEARDVAGCWSRWQELRPHLGLRHEDRHEGMKKRVRDRRDGAGG